MPFEATPVGVGIIGPSRSVQFVLERIDLRRDFVVVAAYVDDDGPALTAKSGCIAVPSDNSVVHDPRARLVFFAGPAPHPSVAAAIREGKHVVLGSPHAILAGELRLLAETAATNGVIGVAYNSRLWADDFLLANTAVQDGRLGRLQRIRLSVHEHSIPGEVFPRGVLRELGFYWFDQLFMLLDDEPRSVYVKQFPTGGESHADGFLAVVDFSGGANAVIELQTRSLSSVRTGWLLEGTNGAYRAGRYYSKTADGEIVDEQLPRPDVSPDPFFDALAPALNGDMPAATRLPNLLHAARVMELIERLEHALRIGGGCTGSS